MRNWSLGGSPPSSPCQPLMLLPQDEYQARLQEIEPKVDELTQQLGSLSEAQQLPSFPCSHCCAAPTAALLPRCFIPNRCSALPVLCLCRSLCAAAGE